MYRIHSTMGDTVFQVFDYYGALIRSFYTEKAAKEFVDRLEAEEYFMNQKKENEAMENLITVSYDDNKPDYSVIICFIHKRASRESQEMRVAYVGEEAEELYKIVTQQGYLKELLNGIRN